MLRVPIYESHKFCQEMNKLQENFDSINGYLLSWLKYILDEEVKTKCNINHKFNQCAWIYLYFNVNGTHMFSLRMKVTLVVV